jgi:hypothetical protein
VALCRYELTGELYDDDEIRSYDQDDITDSKSRIVRPLRSRAGSGSTCSTVSSMTRRTRTIERPAAICAISRMPTTLDVTTTSKTTRK